jgi:hypothetical protein
LLDAVPGEFGERIAGRNLRAGARNEAR